MPKRDRRKYMVEYRIIKKKQVRDIGAESVIQAHDHEHTEGELSTNTEQDDTDISDSDNIPADDLAETGESDVLGEILPDDRSHVSEQQQLATRAFLRTWATSNNLPVSTLDELLKHIHTFMPAVPKCSITLKQTPGKVDIRELCDGQYYYISMMDAIDRYLKLFTNVTAISVKVNIDGVQCYNSKEYSFWPILATLNNSKPYLISLWYGKKKPNNAAIFLEDFVNEMREIITNGYREVEVTLKCFVCDAPARDFIKGICSFNSYFGCERCMCKGLYENGCVRLIDTSAKQRDDKNFASFKYDDHQVILYVFLLN